MKASARAFLAAASLWLAAGAAWRLAPATTTDPNRQAAPGGRPSASSPSRKVSFTYEVFYTNLPIDRSTFDCWIPVPKSDENQKITDLVISVPYGGDLSEDSENGNQILHVRSGPRGGMPMKIKMRFSAERFPVSHPDLALKPPVPPRAPETLARYLKADRLVPLDAATKALADQVTKGKTTAVGKARAIFDYVVDNIMYAKTGEGWGQGDLRYALSAKKGNCAELTTVFTGLARAANIPARFVAGFKIPTGMREGTLTEYHCWAEFYLDGVGWIPVDPSEAARNRAARQVYFGSLDANRIQVTVGRDIVLQPAQHGDPINFFLYPYTEGDGRPVTGNAYRFSWEEGIEQPSSLPAGQPSPVP